MGELVERQGSSEARAKWPVPGFCQPKPGKSLLKAFVARISRDNCHMALLPTNDSATSAWLDDAVARIDADFQRSADTHLITLPLPGFAACGIDFYLKDESTHPTGSLKHRLARSLFLYALCNGWVTEGTTVIEASSGSTAVSEAYFAKLLGLPFMAVMPKTTSLEKIAQIEFYGGQCCFVDRAADVYAQAQNLAQSTGGHYMDQFTYAERATDWRGNNNIAQSLFHQMSRERHPVPQWIVVGAGTGGTSATVGRFVRYQRHATKICVPDPEGSVFADFHRTGSHETVGPGSRIEGIGRPRVEASFIPTVIDRMLTVDNADSIAAMRTLSGLLGRKVGPSTGTNFVGMLTLAEEMRQTQTRGSIVSLLCDSGDRYLPTYHDPTWVSENFGDCTAATSRLAKLIS